MDNYEELHKSICRICLNYGNKKNMVSLIDNNSADGLSCHGKAVLKFANISIKKGDNYPPAMCVKCLNLLKQAIHFKLLCEASDKCLKILATDCGNTKERIVNYTMLKLYFPEECSKQTRTKTKPNPQPETESLTLEIEIKPIKNESSNNRIMNDDYSNDESDEDRLLDEMETLMCSEANTSINIQKPLIKSQKKPIVKNENKPVLKNENKPVLKNENKSVLKKEKKLVLKKEKKPILKSEKKPILKSSKHGILLTHRIIEKVKKGKTPMTCNICNKVLASQYTYRYHMERHSQCRYKCDHCGKEYPVRAQLQYHKLYHHNIGRYIQCPHCPFKAAKKMDLTEHERIHTGERPFTCETCGKTFRKGVHLKKHQLYHAERRVQCPQCPMKFFQKSEMVNHANNVHERVFKYLCYECGATYAQLKTVRKHIVKIHGIPRDKQGKIARINHKDGSDKSKK